MKIALFGDLHIYSHFGKPIFEKTATDFLVFFFNYCIKENIKKVIFLGDFFHVKNKISVLPFIKALDILRDYKKMGLEITFLVGNHDMPQADTTDYSIIHAFQGIGKVVSLYDFEDVGETRLHYLSYTHELPKFESSVKSKNVLFGHLDVQSFSMESNFLCSDGFPISSFTMFDSVFSGHFHKHQIKENITYVGSPYQTRFSERFDKKGFLVLETDTLSWKFIENKEAPVFKEVYVDDLTDEEIINNMKNNFVRVKTHKNNLELPKLKERLISLGVDSVDFIFEEDESREGDINIIENLSTGSMRDLASSYYDSIEKSLTFTPEINVLFEKNEIEKDDFMIIFDNIEHAYLSGWKPEEE